ncbi:MAG: hypothetical protein QOH65_2897 [Methylobacteriaceae bacterium]|jgi:hypothetical protein|nr:hypothetical protein [Methylobacteriaceae bacterium]
MSDLEDLNAKAARLWLEFMQAQAKAAAAAARKLPEVTRSLAEAGVPLAAEVNRWMEGALLAAAVSTEVRPQQATHEGEDEDEDAAPAPPVVAVPEQKSRPAPLLMRANHRRLKAPKSMSRRRVRRP